MNLKTKAKYIKFAILIISICFLIGVISACLPTGISLPQIQEDAISTTARPTTPTTGGFSYFDNGVKYVFTDKDKVDDFRAGAIDRDITIVTVDSSEAQGTQKNPHVITTTDEWEVFVKKMATDSTNGSGQYYVLAADLNFDGVDFHPVLNFKGTFYGLGYSLNNITCANWLYWTGSAYATIGSSNIALGGFGVFCRILEATITDLIVRDYSFQNAPANSTAYSNHGPYVGGVVGLSYGNNTVLNCHTSGEITSTISYTIHPIAGGIVAMHSLASTTLLTYRCSAEVVMWFQPKGTCPVVGGLTGYTPNTSMKVFDCVANFKLTNTTGDIDYASAAVGWGGAVQLENFVGTCTIVTSKGHTSGALIGACGNTVTTKNTYVEGLRGTTEATLASMYPLAGPSAVKLTAASVENFNAVKTTNYASLASGYVNLLPSGVGMEYGSSAIMLAAAKSFFGADAYSNIWDIEKIGDSYDPDNSPVRNYLVATITFKNLLSGENNEEAINGVPTDDYMEGDELPSAANNSSLASYINSKTNHVFLGWTNDKTGESEPCTKLPKGVFGDVTFYAVWGLSETYVNNNITTKLTVDNGIDTIEYDSLSSIGLTASVKHTSNTGGMVNPSVTYYWKQGGNDKASKNTAELSLKLVNESGEYSYEYRIKDGSEPLWYYDGKLDSSEAKTVTINKGSTVKLENFKIDEDTAAYYKKPLNLIEFSGVVKNKADIVVAEASHKWELQNVGKVDSKGTYTTKVVFVPVDTDNYEEKAFYFDVTFDVEELKIIFDMQEAISRELPAVVEYGNNYGSAEIIYLFQTEYMKALASGDYAFAAVSEMAPYLDDAPITADSSGKDIYSGEYNKIDKVERITVTFHEAEYKVTFNYNDDGATPNRIETYNYGQFLKKPTPDPVKDGLLFVGWYFDETTYDDEGNSVTKSRAWRFNSEGELAQDRVSGNLELTAIFLKADTLVSLSATADPTKKYTALSQLTSGDLVVKATFKGDLDGTEVSQDVTLSWSDYSIAYSTLDQVLHVTDGGYKVTVSYTYGTTETADVLIPVVPISVNTSKLTFKDKTVIFDSDDPTKVASIDEISIATLPDEIVSVEYIYTKNGSPVEKDTVYGVGTWIVQAVFTTDSPDYYADPMLATLKISRPTALEKPTFTGGVQYDGTEKNIEDYLENFDSDFMKIVGTSKATEVGRYTITISLTDGAWADGTTSNVSIPWTIDKATLIPTWDSWEFILADTTGSGFAPVISSIADGLADGDTVDYATDFTYKIYDSDGNLLNESEVSDVGTYRIVASINGSSNLNKNYVFDGVSNEWDFVVVPEAGMDILVIEWSDTEFLYDGNTYRPTYVVKDRNGDEVTDTTILSQLVFDNFEYKTDVATYTIKVSVKDSDRYFIRTGSTCKWKIVNNIGDEPPEEGSQDANKPSSGNEGGLGLGALDIQQIIHYWPLIVSVLCVILIMVFLSKAAGYNSARKKLNKKAERLESSVYAAAPLLGMAFLTWEIIAFTLVGLAVVSLVIMIICKSKFSKAEDEYEEKKEEYDRNKAEMYMRMMSGGMGQGMQGGYAPQPALGVDDMRGLISETVTAMLPGVQQMLPAQASTNDELVQKLIEENARSQEALRDLMSKISSSTTSTSERIFEREVASSAVSEAAIKQLIDQNDKNIHKLMQENDDRIGKLMEKILELSSAQNTQPQVVEKEVVKEVPVEKIVKVEVPVEVVKEVPVEKIVEKEVIKEVPVEVEKIVEKEVPVEVIKEVKVEVPVNAPAKPKREVAPRLTLDEAYALLSKEQKKFFDGLKQYVLDKYKCKEKKTTYYVTYGQTATNPLLKLMIKKDITVALLKMEDELMKDIRRDATGDGTKVKVKETEILVTDPQAFDTAKKMIDLRYDQIERYQDLLKEQRAMRK